MHRETLPQKKNGEGRDIRKKGRKDRRKKGKNRKGGLRMQFSGRVLACRALGALVCLPTGVWSSTGLRYFVQQGKLGLLCESLGEISYLLSHA